MSIKVNCPHCDQAYTIADEQAGKKVRCKTCTTVFEVPASGRRREAVTPDSRRTGVREDHDDRDAYDGRDRFDERPRRRRRSGMPVWGWFAIGGGVLLVLALVGTVVILFANGVLGNKVTKENIAKVQMGMTETQVRDILGKPTEDDALGLNPLLGGNKIRVLVWRNGPNQVSVTLIDNKVTGISSVFRN